MFLRQTRSRQASTHLPYTTLFRSPLALPVPSAWPASGRDSDAIAMRLLRSYVAWPIAGPLSASRCTLVRECSYRSEEHTSELQSPCKLVCRLLREQKTIDWEKSNK